jgi:predicted methyltransferase
VTAAAGAVAVDASRPRLPPAALVALVVGSIFASGLLAGVLLERYDEQRGFRAEAERIAQALRLRPGINVGDIRAGSGKWTVDVARRVGPAGQVYATAGPNPAHELLRTVAGSGLDNISVITRTPGARPRLPLQCCEAVLVRAVYHDFADRSALLRSLRQNLKPGGLLAIIDFDEGTPEHAGGHGIARRQVIGEAVAAGFEVEQLVVDWPGNAYCVVLRQL